MQIIIEKKAQPASIGRFLFFCKDFYVDLSSHFVL